MQTLDQQLLDMAIKLEMGGTISGEDAARVIREALKVVDDMNDILAEDLARRLCGVG